MESVELILLLRIHPVLIPHTNVRPNQLVNVWLEESAKWFDRKVFRTKEFDLNAFHEDTDVNTVWVISESLVAKGTGFHKLLESPVFTDITIVSSFADEAQRAWRSSKSFRGHLFRTVAQKSRFNVLLTGTPFPLGPSQDAQAVLRHLGGAFDGSGKWNLLQARGFTRLFESPNHWNILTFRAMIAPFCLRRTRDSTDNGVFIIPRAFAQPVPIIVPPCDDAFSQKVASSRSTIVRKGKTISINQIIERADKQRFIAWTPLYTEVAERTFAIEKQGHKHAIMEEIIVQKLRTSALTGRMERLMRLLKHIVQKKEKFIIVSDRLFLVTVAYFV